MKLTIRSKLIGACIIFAIVVACGVLYLISQISANTQVITEQNTYVASQSDSVKLQNKLLHQQADELKRLALLNDISKQFADLRFWLYDLSVSWLNESEGMAERSRDALNKKLDELSGTNKSLAQSIKGLQDTFYEKMIEAVDAYVDENRVLGNSLVAQARQSSIEIDKKLNEALQEARKTSQEMSAHVETAGGDVMESAHLLQNSASSVLSNNDTLKWVAWTVLLSVVGVSLIFSFTLIRSICTPIFKLRDDISYIQEHSDLTHPISLTSNDELGEMAQALNQMLYKFKEAMQQVNQAASSLRMAMESTNTTMLETHDGVSKQRVETDQVASAITELAATVEQVAKNTADAALAASDADTAAQKGRQIVDTTNAAILLLSDKVKNATHVIEQLHSDSKSIGSLLDVIQGISEQTNLLALNAAIEAARAGEAGRGFAVVADEVRNLAKKTQESTLVIQTTIQNLQGGATQAVKAMEEGRNQAEHGVAQVADAARSLDQITKSVTDLASLNTQIASAAEEQMAVTEHINKSVISISEVASKTTGRVQCVTEQCQDLTDMSVEMERLVGRFKI
ncbi:methyl-accepting chemotaxis protein [Hahella aquimaris]|uniref:methyl-accepting chemotaxis protein n=1 Tax=Hahella sp. HNIBRBA332 TaxID=3015983 RepID=UPI00273ABA05|nr:methyl-accepting chemotaxis protein [Hahella sp. HNIBRBA332]WLQ13296.1 methyl-accepting chemotaxis protein [Hahella sp. HNIBRBA332]